MKTCPHCNQTFTTKEKNTKQFSSHTAWCLENPNRAYRLECLSKSREKLALNRANRTDEDKKRISNLLRLAHANGAYAESLKLRKNKPRPKTSEATKKKQSEGRKKYLLENPDKHPWKRKNKFISIPCEKLKTLLKNSGITFVEEWTPLENRAFSIDIAFPDIKVGIEVNGNQHYTSGGVLRPYYQERHDLITAAGWTLIELHYSDCFNSDKIHEIIKNKYQPDYTDYFLIKEQKRLAKISTFGRGQKAKIAADKKWKPFKDIIINSEIDFSKFGWVKKVAQILPVKNGKINWWMKRYLPDFYENFCFKRKQQVQNTIYS